MSNESFVDKMFKHGELNVEGVLNQIRDYSPKTSHGALKEFMGGSIHADFVGEIAVRIEQMRDFYETCPKNNYLETRGGIAALRLMTGIFETLYENSKSDNQPSIEGDG